MSAVVGAVSITKDVTFNVHLEEELKHKGIDKKGGEPDDDAQSHDAEESEADEDIDDSKLESDKKLDLGPQVSLKEQLEKDKVSSIYLFIYFCFFAFLNFLLLFI